MLAFMQFNAKIPILTASGAMRRPARATLASSALALAAGAALSGAAPAHAASTAATYCVHQAGHACPAGSIDEGSDLQGALTAAAGHKTTTADPNVVDIGPGTYTSSGPAFTYSSAAPLRVVGSGTGSTTLAGPSGGIRLESTTDAQTVSIANLTVAVSGANQTGLAIVRGRADHVSVVDDGPVQATGVELQAATLASSTVTATGNASDGVEVISPVDGIGAATTSELDDDTVDAANNGVKTFAAVTVHRTRLSAAYGVSSDSGAAYVDDSLIRATGAGLVSADDAVVGPGSPAEGSINALNDTLVAASGAPVGVIAQGDGSQGSDIQILNSIIHGFTHAFVTTAQSGDQATIETGTDNYDGDTIGVTAAASIGGDPGFVNAAAGDYHLRWNSPLIDRSTTTNVGSLSSTTDLDGNPRVIADGRPTTPVDLGAYEYQRRAPSVIAHVPASATAGSPVAFSSSGNDPDPGDALTYRWTFDDGASATGASVTHAFTTAGAHSATVTVTDPTGLHATARVTVAVANPSPTPGHPTPPAPTPPPSPTPGPAPAPKSPHSPANRHPAATARLVARPVTIVGGDRIRVRLACGKGAPCAGVKIRATTVERRRRGRLVGVSASRPKRADHSDTRQVVIASASRGLRAGRSATVTLSLNRSGTALLVRFGRLPVQITVTVRRGRRAATVRTLTTALRAPAHAPRGGR